MQRRTPDSVPVVPTRRQVVVGAAWAVPAVAVTVAIPAHAVSQTTLSFTQTSVTSPREQNILLGIRTADASPSSSVVALSYSAGMEGPSTVVAVNRQAYFFVRGTEVRDGWVVASDGSGSASMAMQITSPTFQDLRRRWQLFTVGESLHIAQSDPNIVSSASSALRGYAAGARQWVDSMTLESSSLWSDLPLGSNSANLTSTAARLRAIVVAGQTSGTSLTGDTSLGGRVAAGIVRLISLAYSPTATEYGNWWDWQIGVPQNLLSAAIFSYPSLAPSDRGTIIDAVRGHVTDSRVAVATGANKTDLVMSKILSGVFSDDGAEISVGMSALPKVLDLVSSGDGFYSDGSFVQHTRVAYTGTYGAELMRGLALMAGLVAGTSWALSTADLDRLRARVEDGILPLLIASIIPDAVSGRAISRSGDSDNRRARHMIAQLVRLGDVMGGPSRGRWRSRVADSLSREQLTSPVSMSQDEYSSLADVLRDQSIVASGAGTSRAFTMMSRAVIRADTWGASIAMTSTRTTYYEYGNGENRRGWHTGVGMVGWWGSGGAGAAQFADAYWPTVDPYAHPGITVSTKPVPDGFGGAWTNRRPNIAWAGGCVVERAASIGTIVRPMNSTLIGRKSWFFAEGLLVCLGGDISSTDGYPVSTIVDNRNTGADGGATITVDDAVLAAPAGSAQLLTEVRWVHIEGSGGYVLLTPGPVSVLRENRSGRWSDISGGGSTTVLTRQYVKVSIDHGLDPTSATYGYVMIPASSVDEVRAVAVDIAGRVATLAQDASAHAVRFEASGIVAANLWTAGASVAGVTVSQPLSILFHAEGEGSWLAVADAQAALSTVDITIDSAGSYSGGDPRVTVLSQGARLELRVDLSGSQGSTVVVPLELQ